MIQKIFLETTIQAERNFSPPPRRNEINEKLRNKKLISSTYVMGEIKFNFLKETINFYNLVQDAETTGEALDRLSRKLRSKNQYARVIKMFSFITEDGKMLKRDVLSRLNILIDGSFVSRFNRGLELPLMNETSCTRASVEPVLEDGLWKIKFLCNNKMKEICKMCTFIEKYNENFKDIEELGKENNADIAKSNIPEMANALIEIRENNKKPYGRRCWKIGDAVICNEVPKDSFVYTTNLKDYKPICEKIKKVLYE